MCKDVEDKEQTNDIPETLVDEFLDDNAMEAFIR